MSVSVLNTDAGLSAKTLVVAESTATITGLHTYDRDPSAPFAVSASSAVVTNLDADKLDGIEGASFLRSDAADTKDSGDLTFNDNVIATFGTGGDADLYYDGTDLILNTAVVGTGALSLTKGQIKFPASQNASGDANTLDDYEEGSWTPVIGGSGGTSGQAYTVQEGNYTKIGRLVILNFRVILSTEGTITGNVQIQGLPFTVSGGNDARGTAVGVFAGLATNWVNVSATPSGGTTVALIRGAAAAGTANTTALTAADIGNTSDLGGTLIFII